ncbi:hypothetical protein ZWY2020_034619 [Hordeum vulgare]|nr:hypothetical protein ZWY2020_034619 [Hordeum vulgare]
MPWDKFLVCSHCRTPWRTQLHHYPDAIQEHPRFGPSKLPAALVSARAGSWPSMREGWKKKIALLGCCYCDDWDGGNGKSILCGGRG